MAYTAVTWAPGDLISDTSLNRMEQGIEDAYLISESVIDADKNWNGKSITHINDISGNRLYLNTGIFYASSAIKYSDPNVPYTFSPGASFNTWIVKKTYSAPYMMPPASSIQIQVTAKSRCNLSKLRVYKNGAPVGIEHTVGSTDYATFIDLSIPVNPGDTIELWQYSGICGDTAVDLIYVSDVKFGWNVGGITQWTVV